VEDCCGWFVVEGDGAGCGREVVEDC